MENMMSNYRRSLKLVYSMQHTIDQQSECSFWHPPANSK